MNTCPIRSILLVFLVCFTNCILADEVQDQIAILTNRTLKNWALTLNAQRNLAKLGKPAVEPLIALLTDTNSSARFSAVRPLGKLGDTRAVEPLIGLLKDDNLDQIRRQFVEEALGELRDARAVEPLIACLSKHYNSEERRYAAVALGKLGGVRAVDALIALLEDQNLRIEAASLLGELGDTRAVEPLIALLKDQNLDSGQQKIIAKALSGLGYLAPAAAIEKEEATRLATVQQLVALGESKRMAQIRASLPTNRDQNAIYWLIETTPGVFKLKQTIPCTTGGGVSLAETVVPCGAVFVNMENQIGGNYFFLQPINMPKGSASPGTTNTP